jgi:DNA adenine methylase
LQQVQLESWPYERVLERYDRPTSFFYLDPPYVGRQLYHFNFTDEDFAQLATRLTTLRGTFLLSINDCELARDLFGRFHCRQLAVAYTAARAVPTVQELLFSNYELPPNDTPTPPRRPSSAAIRP